MQQDGAINLSGFVVTRDDDGTVYIASEDGRAPLIALPTRLRGEIAVAIITAISDGAWQADLAKSGPEPGGVEKTLLRLDLLPATRGYAAAALHYVLMVDLEDETLTMAAGRPASRSAQDIATVIV